MTAPDIAKTIAYSAVALMALAFGAAALLFGNHAASSLGEFDAVLETMNRPCRKDVSCGTLADIAKTLNTIRGTAGQIEVAARHENKQLATIDMQEAQLYQDLHSGMGAVDLDLKDVHAELQTAQQLTASLTGASLQATTDMQAMNKTIQAAQPVLAAANVIVNHADALVTDKSIPRLLAAAADTTTQADATATDVRKVSDKITNQFLNPPPKHWWNYAGRVWNVVWQGAMLAK